MDLELLAITLGLCTFREQIAGRNVIVHCDNSGAEVAFRKGNARSFDHAQLVHQQWLLVVRERLRVYVKRVATMDNIVDLPSRGDHKLMHLLKACEMPPVMEESFLDSASWDVLNERWAL